ncbi:hypothetical protein C8F04DRAFT_591729 [Mycena alexandri]|uniref:Uncharacterized protein n=1 Tax=Mycena alexandri TaxID=1745969 RepID=A0AAD6TIQ1_9AGAR|nr:hypothetical protein C8F04DRAFT_591729 [Mycena alexandri]
MGRGKDRKAGGLCLYLITYPLVAHSSRNHGTEHSAQYSIPMLVTDVLFSTDGATRKFLGSPPTPSLTQGSRRARTAPSSSAPAANLAAVSPTTSTTQRQRLRARQLAAPLPYSSARPATHAPRPPTVTIPSADLSVPPKHLYVHCEEAVEDPPPRPPEVHRRDFPVAPGEPCRRSCGRQWDYVRVQLLPDRRLPDHCRLLSLQQRCGVLALQQRRSGCRHRRCPRRFTPGISSRFKSF